MMKLIIMMSMMIMTMINTYLIIVTGTMGGARVKIFCQV